MVQMVKPDHKIALLPIYCTAVPTSADKLSEHDTVKFRVSLATVGVKKKRIFNDGLTSGRVLRERGSAHA
jgi:hypothetical protein